jgi:hypothetical protein
MTIKVDIRLVIQASIASDGTTLGEQLSDVLQSAADGWVKEKDAVASRQLIQLNTSAGGDEILPFELAPFELSLACLLAGRSSFTKPSWNRFQYSAGHHAKIFSNWSLVDEGYALITRNKCVYIPNATCESPQRGETEFEIRPACKSQFSQALRRFSDTQPSVRVQSDDNVRFLFDTGIALENQEMQCRCWIIGPTSGPELLSATRLSRVSRQRVALEFLRPEAILQLSAAASKGHWLHIQGSELDVIFPVPDITGDAQSCKLWSRSFVAWHGYLEGSITGDIDLPKTIAKECVRRYWWMTLSDRELMLEAISHEITSEDRVT